MDYNKLIQGGAAGILLTIAFQVNNAYNTLTDTLKENTRANIELLILHREWFGQSQRNSSYENPDPTNPATTVEASNDNRGNRSNDLGR